MFYEILNYVLLGMVIFWSIWGVALCVGLIGAIIKFTIEAFTGK